MLNRREIDQITVAIRECLKEYETTANPYECVEQYLNRLRRRGWSEERVVEVEEGVAHLLTDKNTAAKWQDTAHERSGKTRRE